MELRQLFYAIIRSWWLIVICAGGCGAIGFYVYIYSATPTYGARTTLCSLNQTKILAGQALTSQDITLGQQLVTQYGNIFYSTSVASPVAEKLSQYNLTINMLLAMSKINITEESNILVVETRFVDPVIAAEVANAMSTEFATRMRELTQTDYIDILDEAQISKQPIPSNGKKMAVYLMIVGVVVAIGMIYIREYFYARIYSIKDIENHLKMQVAGIIPDYDVR
jgi:capsular polysaccharide biosynthesis protein